MQKTKLGLTIGMLSAVVYFTALFGGLIPLFLLVGYILLFEQNDWLRMVSFKAVALTIAFSVISAVIGLIPSALGCISNFLSIFEVYFNYSPVSSLISVINGIINIVKIIIFLMLAFKAMKLQDIKISLVDKFIEN